MRGLLNVLRAIVLQENTKYFQKFAKNVEEASMAAFGDVAGVVTMLQ
jgi:hypothetical protein